MSTFSLPPDLEQFVQKQLAVGKYQTASDVLCDGVRLLQQRDQQLESLKSDIDRGIAQLDTGDFMELQSEAEILNFFQDIERRGHQRLSANRREP